MPIIRRHRQTVLDHDPRTGAVVGATKIFARHVEEDGKNLGKLEPENEPLDLADVPKLWGDTTNEFVLAHKQSEEALVSERESRAQAEASLLARISELEGLLSARSEECDRLKGLVFQIRKVLMALLEQVNT